MSRHALRGRVRRRSDPEREALDAKLNAGGKVEPHEIASKTQMFTERYIVEWLLHNSLGQMWLAMCKKHGWTAEVMADGTLERLEARRKAWREKRENGEVAPDALMPIETEAEDRWKYGGQIAKGTPLRNCLRLSFFKDVHLGMYENRPIYFPLSSAKKNFVALVSIHRWADNTLQTLLADYLMPELNQLQGALSDLMQARNMGNRKSQAEAEKRYSEVQQLHDELKTFIDLVRQCAEQGPLPAKTTDTRREVDARFQMDLDDGVMINSAALWCRPSSFTSR